MSLHSRKSLAPLHLPLLVLLVTLAGAALLVFGASHFAGSMEDSQSRLEHDLNEARIRKMQARNREAGFRTDADTYHQLMLRGLRGPEQRLTWVDETGALARQFGLSRSDYQLAPQRPFAQVASDEGKVVRIHATRVTLSLDAPHEGRLLGFLQALDARIPGLLLARQCQFDSSGGDVPLVHASCSLDWLTLDADSLPAGAPAAMAGLATPAMAARLPGQQAALGNLFTTPAERNAIDHPPGRNAGARPQRPAPVTIGPAPPPEQHPDLSGFVLRSGGSNTYWLDGSGGPHSGAVGPR